MSVSSTPRLSDAEVARRALKMLAERRVVPTPTTFTEVCHEIAGIRNGGVTASAIIRDVLRDLVKSGRLSTQESAALTEAAQAQHWLAVREGLDLALARKSGGTQLHWPQLTLNLLRQADALHSNWTRARKLDAVARVIDGAADQPDLALERLTRLIESWGSAMPAVPAAREGSDGPTTLAGGPTTLPVVPGELRAPERRLTDARSAVDRLGPEARPVADQRPVTERYGSDPALQEARDRAQAEAEAWKQVALRAANLLAQACGEDTAAAKRIHEYVKDNTRQNLEVAAVARIAPRFTDLVSVIERQLAEEHQVRQGLQRLLAMLCDNIKTLSPDEVWLAGQLEPIRALLSHPVRALALEQAQTRLAQVIASQSRARVGLQEAKIAVKEMLTTLLESIGLASQSAGTFCTQVEGYQKELERANDFETLSRVVHGLLVDTAAVREGIEKSRTELVHARSKVEAYEARVQELERELSQVSTLVQKDPLTFALNRRGLEEAFRVESMRAKRYSAPLSLAVLDLDDFKRVNDSLGHAAGDRALVHLATTLQLALRPNDYIARFGGEEFALLLPVTDLEGALEAGERLLKEMAQRPFIWQGQLHVITFSVGVCQWRVDETLECLVQRADTAMYEAKRAGKNRVVRAADY